MNSQVKILGCGDSAGVPRIGNDWDSCDPANPKNRRTRPSILIEHGGKTLVIDTGPDFKEQVNTHQIKNIDGVLYTHYHSDHMLGLDDLRHWCKNRKIADMPLFMNEETYDITSVRFDYILTSELSGFYPILFHTHRLLPAQIGQRTEIVGIPLTLYNQDHKTCTSLGVRFGNVAYSTDMVNLDDAAIDVIRGVDVWIADCARYTYNATVHANLDIVYALNEKIGAKQVYLTHMPAYMDYAALVRDLPDGYAPAYDGLVLPVSV